MAAFEGRVALITGASRGIGAAVARRLSDEGAALALASRSGVDLGLPRTVALPTDVRDPAALDALAAATAERFGGIDIVVANAGIGAYGPFEELALEQLDAMIDVNLKGTLYTARATVPYLLRSPAADFVSLASEAGRRGLPGEAVYCASKFGQVGFTRALEGELRERGVRCASVCPGGVHTDFAMGAGREPGMPMLEGMMRAEDVADIVLHVLTRPRHLRILETALRPMSEASWG
ncbi:MAG TPA: SDR family NAD(P)-dependent oxidoreductase [Solirubrobacteraceae bacterium]|nr:SDR family NAD(P)-dependent oxidoreductase [Solirubrobacteraceae bacterium]